MGLAIAGGVVFLVAFGFGHLADRREARHRALGDGGCPLCGGALQWTVGRRAKRAFWFTCGACSAEWIPVKRSTGVVALEPFDRKGILPPARVNEARRHDE